MGTPNDQPQHRLRAYVAMGGAGLVVALYLGHRALEQSRTPSTSPSGAEAASSQPPTPLPSSGQATCGRAPAVVAATQEYRFQASRTRLFAAEPPGLLRFEVSDGPLVIRTVGGKDGSFQSVPLRSVSALAAGAGRVWLGGSFEGRLDPGGGARIESSGGRDGVVLAYATDGRLLASQQLAGKGEERIGRLVAKGDGVVVTATYEGEASLGTALPKAKGSRRFVAALDGKASPLWTHAFDDEVSEVFSLAAADGGIAVALRARTKIGEEVRILQRMDGSAASPLVRSIQSDPDAPSCVGLLCRSSQKMPENLAPFEVENVALAMGSDGILGVLVDHRTLTGAERRGTWVIAVHPQAGVRWARRLVRLSVTESRIAVTPAGDIVVAGVFAHDGGSALARWFDPEGCDKQVVVLPGLTGFSDVRMLHAGAKGGIQAVVSDVASDGGATGEVWVRAE